MQAETTITNFYCDYCHQKFLVADYNNDIEATKEAVCEHQKNCRNKIKICLGDVFLFDIQTTGHELPLCCCLLKQLGLSKQNKTLTPPLKVIYVDITNPQMKILHVVLTKYNHILGVWEVDQEAMKWYKQNYNIKYFTLFENQINRQINLKDFKESFKLVDVLSEWVDDTNKHNKKQCETNIGYDFQNNNILLTIKIPYKTKGRIK